MSATNRGSAREEKDNYPTPQWCIDRLLDARPEILCAKSILEPCAGDGAVVRALRRRGFTGYLEAWDVRVEPSVLTAAGANIAIRRDAFVAAAEAEVERPFDCIVTNPPYSHAKAFVDIGLVLALRQWHLLRVSFLGSQQRASWLQRYTPSVLVLPNRPSFVKGKTDNCEYAWMEWDGNEAPGRRWPTVQILDLTGPGERKGANRRGLEEERGAPASGGQTEAMPANRWQQQKEM